MVGYGYVAFNDYLHTRVDNVLYTYTHTHAYIYIYIYIYIYPAVSRQSVRKTTVVSGHFEVGTNRDSDILSYLGLC